MIERTAPAMLDVTVIVVTYNSAAVVGECLRSLPAAFAGVTAPTVVVVDNASTDETVGVVRAASPDARLFRLASNRGYAAAINAGVRAVPGGVGEALLVLNPDIRLAPGSVAPLVAALGGERVGIAVPRLVDDDGDVLLSLRRRPTVLRALGEAVLGGDRAGRHERLGEVISDPRAYRSPRTVDWATGAAMLVSRRCAEAVGDWDESFFLYSEEVDYALRAADAGFTVRYEPAATAVHLGGQSGDDPDLWSTLTRNRIRLYKRRHGAVRTSAFTAAVALNEALRTAAGRRTNRAALRSLLRADRSKPTGPSPPGGVVCFSAQDWWYFNRAHSDFQLLTRVAQQRPVLLVNSLGMRMPMPGRTQRPWVRIGRKFRSLTRGLRQPLPEVPGFSVLTPVFLPVYRPGRLRDLSDRLVAWQVRQAVRWLGLGLPDVIVTLPTAWGAVRRLPHRSLVVNRSDLYSAFGEADGGWVASLEQRLLADADAAAYASTALLEAEAAMTRHPVLLDHGVDLDRFRPSEDQDEPVDLRGIRRPRIGFFGAIDDYTVDFTLVQRLATELSEASIVLVGPANCSMQPLTRLGNVHWLGPRSPEEVPRYGSGFDVAIMPWLTNEWIRFCNPIKLKEYLALGLPVVTTTFPEADRYASVVRIARDADQFVRFVRQTLHDGGPATPARRRAFVAGDSWDRRASELLELFDAVAPSLPADRQTCAAS